MHARLQTALCALIWVGLVAASGGVGSAEEFDPNGLWIGAWGGRYWTAITIRHNEVVDYRFQDQKVAIGKSKFDGHAHHFGNDKYEVSFTLETRDVARGKYKGPSGGSEAIFLRARLDDLPADSEGRKSTGP
jgi:hypothetical protein